MPSMGFKPAVPAIKRLQASALDSGPYLGILRPWAQENFAPPPYLFVFSYV